MTTRQFLSITLVISLFGYSCSDNATNISPKDNAQNIILLIGDGMGIAQIQATAMAQEQPLNINRMEYSGYVNTSSASSKITDSAAGGTAIACGVKTNNGAIGVDSQGNALKSILEYAEERGLATGLVATSTITHATPASFIAHEQSRSSYEAIARDFLDVDIDVFIGGGLDHFTNRSDGADLTADLRANDYQVALTIDEAELVSAGKLAGLLNTGALPRMLDGRGDVLLRASKKALELLTKDEDGFFLMIEGSQIDWGGHSNDIDYVITELQDFDTVIGYALDFAEANGNTLVIVTADHETGGLSIPGEDVLTDSLATNFATTHHTAVKVPIFASGPGAELYTGTFENNKIFAKMMTSIGLTVAN